MVASAAEPEYPIVPAGKEFAVQFQERVDSAGASAGDTFDVRIVDPIKEDGATLIPQGAAAKAELVTVPEVGAGGTHVYAIELKQVQVNGDWYPVTTGFANVESGVRMVHERQGKAVVPTGTTDVDKIVSASAYGEGAAAATVHGAGVSFQLLRGPSVAVASGTIAHFTLAELIPLRPEEALAR